MPARLFFILALTLAAAFYVPLHRTHGALVERYAALAASAKALEHDLGRARATLATTQAQGDKLTQEHRAVEARDAARATGRERSRKLVEARLASAIERGQATVSARGDRVVVRIASALTGAGTKTDVAKSAMPVLCDVASAAPASSRVQAFAHAGEDAKGHGWASASAGAAGIARTLERKCGLSVDRFDVAVRAQPADVPDAKTIAIEIAP